jgi:hypothetical protein
MRLSPLEVSLCLYFLPQSPSLNIESRVFACVAAPTLAALLKSSDLWLSTEGACDRCNCDTSNALLCEPSASHCVMPGRSCIRRTFCMARQLHTVWDVGRGKATSVPCGLSSCRRCSICLLSSVAVVGLSSAREGGRADLGAFGSAAAPQMRQDEPIAMPVTRRCEGHCGCKYQYACRPHSCCSSDIVSSCRLSRACLPATVSDRLERGAIGLSGFAHGAAREVTVSRTQTDDRFGPLIGDGGRRRRRAEMTVAAWPRG